jgi:hypothetical protein
MREVWVVECRTDVCEWFPDVILESRKQAESKKASFDAEKKTPTWNPEFRIRRYVPAEQ